jgi:hypothetical protein
MKSMMDDVVAAVELDAQIQAVLDFHDVFGAKSTKRPNIGLSREKDAGETQSKAAKAAVDARRVQKLASIRDIMSRDRCFDANAKAASFRCILGNERELSLENFLDAVDEFDGELFETDFHVPTIEPPSSSPDEASAHLIPMDDEDERSGSTADLFAFPASPGGRAKRNTDADFNPFEDIDRRLKALREARIQMKLPEDDSSRGELSLDNVPKSARSQRSKLSITSLKAESIASSGSDESSEIPIAAPPMRRRSSTSTKASNLSHESFGAHAPLTPSRSGPRKMQRGVGASEVIKRHLEKRNRKEEPGLATSTRQNTRLQSPDVNAKIQEIISKRLEIINRTVEPVAECVDPGPSVSVRTTRRFAARRSVASNDANPSSTEIAKALDVLTKHLEARLQKTEAPTDVSPPRPASPSRRRRTVGMRTASDCQDRAEGKAKLSLLPELDGTSGAVPVSPRRAARRARVKTSELTETPTLSPARTIKSQESPDLSETRSSSPSRRRNRTSRAGAASKAEMGPAPAKSHAAQVIKEHLERLQLHNQNKEAFQAISDWANDNTTERTEDPFCLDNVAVPISVAARNLAVPDMMSDTDATTSERSEDPFQMSVGSGMSSYSRQSASAGMSPRRKPTSRRISTSNGKASSRTRSSRATSGNSGESGIDTHAMLAAAAAAPPTMELPSLPELSEDENADGSRHHVRSIGGDPSCRQQRRRERSKSPSKRAQMEMAALAALF